MSCNAVWFYLSQLPWCNISDHNILMFDNKVEDFERICERVGNVRDEAVAQGARIVHRTKQVRTLPRNMENYMRTSWRKFYVGRSRDSSKVKACSTCRHTGLHKIFAGHHNPTSLYLQVPGKVLESVKHWNHLSFAKLPAWMKDNEFIKFYHRFFSFHFYFLPSSSNFTTDPSWIVSQSVSRVSLGFTVRQVRIWCESNL